MNYAILKDKKSRIIAVAVLFAIACVLAVVTANTAKGERKQPDGAIAKADAVFYIAVKETPSSDIKYYYYTMEELQAYETTESFTYNDHYLNRTTIAKGAPLQSLLDNLEGVNISGSMIIQYAEADGFHADVETIIDNSWSKDKVKWLTQPYYRGNVRFEPTRAIVTYAVNDAYEQADTYNPNDPEGVFTDADDSGYLRVYRNVGSDENDIYASVANTTIMKYIMGVVISPDGRLFSGNDGYAIELYSDKNSEVKISEDVEVKGLLPGMQYPVKIPALNNAVISPEQQSGIITANVGASEKIALYYDEQVYFYVIDDAGKQTDFTFSDLAAIMIQIPDSKGRNQGYGYEKPMYYRYNGIWLSDILRNLNRTTAIETIEIISQNGNMVAINPAETGNYFLALSNTNSKNSLDPMEDERVSTVYNHAKMIIPAEGLSVYGEESELESNYAVEGKNVGTLVEEAVGLSITRKTSQ